MTCHVPGCASPRVDQSVCVHHKLAEMYACLQHEDVRASELADLDGREAPAPESLPRPRIRMDGDGTPYGKAALRGIVQELAEVENGTRNNALNRAAFNVATLVAGGQVPEVDAMRALRHVAEAIGLPRFEAKRTIRSGWTKGLENPRTPRAA